MKIFKRFKKPLPTFFVNKKNISRETQLKLVAVSIQKSTIGVFCR
tara:strand:- start:263 stop:397 length:135 start_codon:yes stop_codon:yes gene_type:complete